MGQSIPPRERVNITYKPATGDAQENIELPFKLLMMGDYTLRPDDRLVEDRKPINVDKDNFNEVMRSQNLSLKLNVENKLSEEGGQMAVDLKFNTLNDFSPESIANQVPEMNKLMQLRTALQALKGPLGNIPEFRKKLQELLDDVEAREKLLKELGVSEQKEEESK
ncbi:TPA: type VI secretion system contractile sheath small subunit [Candidatus Poribacteria bacterium]|nr:type VI secretion system contractile sheath small subunit [Candidatus Poribacteria bacterium]